MLTPNDITAIEQKVERLRQDMTCDLFDTVMILCRDLKLSQNRLAAQIKPTLLTNKHTADYTSEFTARIAAEMIHSVADVPIICERCHAKIRSSEGIGKPEIHTMPQHHIETDWQDQSNIEAEYSVGELKKINKPIPQLPDKSKEDQDASEE